MIIQLRKKKKKMLSGFSPPKVGDLWLAKLIYDLDKLNFLSY